MKKLISAVLVLTMIVACFAGCGKSLPQATTPAAPAATEAAPAAPAETEAPKDLAFAEGTILRMATGYNSKKTGLFFDAEVAGEGIQLADGVTYQAGDLKPTWVEVQTVWAWSSRTSTRATPLRRSSNTGRIVWARLIWSAATPPPSTSTAPVVPW